MFMGRISLCENIHLGSGIFNFDNDMAGGIANIFYIMNHYDTPTKIPKYHYGG